MYCLLGMTGSQQTIPGYKSYKKPMEDYQIEVIPSKDSWSILEH
jgi:hypothetical protein